MSRKQMPEDADHIFETIRGLGTTVLEESAAPLMRDVLLLQPTDVALEGFYLRQWIGEDEMQRFIAAVSEAGQIEQPVGIREAGNFPDVRYILVYGSKRHRAATALGLPLPARNYGAITEAEAVLLQAAENANRADEHVLDRARTFHTLAASFGYSQPAIGRAFGRDQGYVSVLARVGEAFATLPEDVQMALYRSAPAVRDLQEIAKGTTAERARRLRSLATRAEKPRPRKEKEPTLPLRARDTPRGGRAVQFRWDRRLLASDAEGYVRQLEALLAHEISEIATTLAGLEGAPASAIERVRSLSERFERA